MEIEKQKFGTIANFQLEKTLGTGANAKVKLGIQNGTQYAVKIMKRDNQRAMKEVKHECDMLKDLNHPNIVNLQEAGKSSYISKGGNNKGEKFYIVMELADGGEIFEYVANTGPFSEKSCRTYFKQCLDGLAYCHKNGLCHRDLKPENILYDSKYNIKIADFGFATLCCGKNHDNLLKTVLGTEGYMAPEIHMKKPYSGESVDLFAIAIILFILYAGTPPFQRAHPNDPYYKLLANNQIEKFWAAHSRFKQKGYYSNEFKDMITSMLAFDPNKRLNMQEVLDSKWMQQEHEPFENVQKEFIKRGKTVQASLDAERQAKEKAKMRKQNQKGGMQDHGVSGFRSMSETQRQEFMHLESEYEGLKLERQIANKNENNVKPNDYVTKTDADYLLRCLIHFNQGEKSKIALDDKKYKINTFLTNKDGECSFDAKIASLGPDDLNVIQFVRQEGDLMNFYEVTKKLKKKLDDKLKTGEDYHEEEEQKQN